MNSVTIRKEKNEINQYNIVEYAIGDTFNRHKFNKTDDNVNVDRGIPVYRSYFLHSGEIKDYFLSHKDEKGRNTLAGYVGCVLSDQLKIDIDEKDDSLDQVRKLLRYWEANYDLDLRHIRVNFSGSKGFHIRIPAELFGGFEPSEELPGIHKQIALDLTEGVKIDESVYKTTGLFREVNSINQKSGLFAVPLTVNELFSLDYDQIKDLAKNQRQVDYLEADEMIEVEALRELKDTAVADAGTSNTRINLKSRKGFWEPADEGERFDKLTSAVGRLIRTNLSNEDILQLGLIINNQYNPPKDKTIVSRQIQDLIKKYGNIEGEFWKISRGKLKNKTDKIEVEINEKRYIDFLNSEGFAKIYMDKYPFLIRVEGNIIKEYSTPMVKDYVFGYIGRIDPKVNPYTEHLQNKILSNINKYFNQGLLECVETKTLELQADEKDKAYLYYKNGFVTVEKNNPPVLTSFTELKSPIWESSIIQREIHLLQEKTQRSEFEIFLQNVMRNNEERFLSICSAIGYLLHGFKNMSNAKAVIFCDEVISDEPNGRSGKSLVGKAIRQMKPTANIDGKNFKFGERFTFQAIDLDTKIVDFNDVRKDFDFERLFSVVTDDMLLEYKGEKIIRVSFKDSPKIMVSTNYTIKGNGSSYKDRMYEIEFSDHYNDYHKPVDEFGHLFFQDWEEAEWNRFDNFMLECLQLYLDEGLIGCAPLNLEVRKLRDQTNPEFVDFADENVILDIEYNLKELYERFKRSIGYDFEFTNPCPIKQNTFTEWLKVYSGFKGLDFNKRPSNGRQIVTVKSRGRQ